MTPRTLRFWRQRETRNTVVFAEEHQRGTSPLVGLLYVRKEQLEAWGNPEVVVVTVAPGAEWSGAPEAKDAVS